MYAPYKYETAVLEAAKNVVRTWLKSDTHGVKEINMSIALGLLAKAVSTLDKEEGQ